MAYPKRSKTPLAALRTAFQAGGENKCKILLD
jgi:hypothetical protein